MADKYPMIGVEDAERLVLSQILPLPCVSVPLMQACGKVLAEDVINPTPFPPFPASIKDGYAVVASDGPGEYDLVGSFRAASLEPNKKHIEVVAGTVAYVTTGAPVPRGADAVVGIERTSRTGEGENVKVHLDFSVKAGADIRPVGSDMARGQTILSRGSKIGPAEVGLLATAGLDSVAVYRTPRVGVLSTGDELVDAAEKTLQYGQIRDANRYMLLAAVAEAGAEGVDMGIVKDQENDLEGKLDDALRSFLHRRHLYHHRHHNHHPHHLPLPPPPLPRQPPSPPRCL